MGNMHHARKWMGRTLTKVKLVVVEHNWNVNDPINAAIGLTSNILQILLIFFSIRVPSLF